MHQIRPIGSITLLLILSLPFFVLGQSSTGRGRTSAASPTPVTATPSSSPTAKASPTPNPTTAAQKVKLFYMRDATKIVTVLTEIAQQSGSKLEGLVAKNTTDDEVILYGPAEQRKHAWQIIAVLDLPRPGVNMEMWGVQIASNKPEQMEVVMPAVRRQIDSTQRAVNRTYEQLQELTIDEIKEGDLNADFKKILVDELAYKSALDVDRPLSLTDILLRMIAADNAGSHAEQIANRLHAWFLNLNFLTDPGCPKSTKRTHRAARLAFEVPAVPFQRFFTLRGLDFTGAHWTDRGVDARAKQGRELVADFAFHYGRLVHQPQSFGPYPLQQSADALNARLQMATDAINADLEEMFVRPTLLRIGEIVRCYEDVDYAQVGKVSVASLSGVETEVKSQSVNVFDVTPPLKLSELLTKASELTQKVTPFDPAQNTIGALSLSQVIGLIAAFGEEDAVWKRLHSGVSVTVTPNVLRNMTSAELKIDLETGDPEMSGTQEKDVRPISRVSQHNVKTSVYVNALDFFDLSTFVSQATLGGGRGMVPVIGPIWHGLFGEIPVAGKLFSWQKSPKTVYSDSLILTNSFITPTAMGIALLYPTDIPPRCQAMMKRPEYAKQPDVALDNCFNFQAKEVDIYKDRNRRGY